MSEENAAVNDWGTVFFDQLIGYFNIDDLLETRKGEEISASVKFLVKD